jgi:PhoH-like ATPase
MQKIYVVDTNVILQNIQNIINLSDEGENIVVIPETVLVEVEEKKKLFTDIGYQAREFARFLADAKVTKIEDFNDFKVVRMENNSIIIDLISKESYKNKIKSSSLAESNDKRIVEVAALAKKHYINGEVIFISIDVYARMFGLFENLKTESLRDDKAEIPKLEFFKSIEVDSTLFNSIDYKDIRDFDP